MASKTPAAQLDREIAESRLVHRAQREWSKLAGEPVEVELISGGLYALGSELAVLRLFYKFRHSKGVDAKFSKNLNSWAFGPVETHL